MKQPWVLFAKPFNCIANWLVFWPVFVLQTTLGLAFDNLFAHCGTLPMSDYDILPAILCTSALPSLLNIPLHLHLSLLDLCDRMLRHNPDAAESAQLTSSLTAQGYLEDQERWLQEVLSQVQQLTSHMSLLCSNNQALLFFCLSLINIAYLDKYAGNPDKCRCFLLQWRLYFGAMEGMSELSKIYIMISLLTGDGPPRWYPCASGTEKTETESFVCKRGKVNFMWTR